MESLTKPQSISETTLSPARLLLVPRITALERLLSRTNVLPQVPKTAPGPVHQLISMSCQSKTQDPALTNLTMAKKLCLRTNQTACSPVFLSLTMASTMARMVMAEKSGLVATPLPQHTMFPITNRVLQSLSVISPINTTTTTKCLDPAPMSQTHTTPSAHSKLCKALPILEDLQNQIKLAQVNTKIV